MSSKNLDSNQSSLTKNEFSTNTGKSFRKFKIVDNIRNRVGTLVGLNSVLNSVKSVRQTYSSSLSRTFRLWGGVSEQPEKLISQNSVKSDTNQFFTLMKQYQVDVTKLDTMVVNTKRNFNLYVIIFCCSIIFGAMSIIMFPPNHLLNGLIRFIAVPLLGALMFKHAYSNWLFRNRKICSPFAFLCSKDRWPKSSNQGI